MNMDARINMIETAAFLVRRIDRLDKAIAYYHKKYGNNGSEFLYNLYYRRGLYEAIATYNTALLMDGSRDDEFGERIMKGRI